MTRASAAVALGDGEGHVDLDADDRFADGTGVAGAADFITMASIIGTGCTEPGLSLSSMSRPSVTPAAAASVSALARALATAALRASSSALAESELRKVMAGRLVHAKPHGLVDDLADLVTSRSRTESVLTTW